MALTPKQIVASGVLGPGWVYDPRSRGAFNAILPGNPRKSRRELETRYGTLAAEGYTSYEKKAKARREAGLAGARRVKGRPGVFDIKTTDPRERKAIIRRLPRDATVYVLAHGDDPTERYQGRIHNQWRYLNFNRSVSRKAIGMSPDDLLSVWDSRASRAGKVIKNPDQWIIRVSIPRK